MSEPQPEEALTFRPRYGRRCDVCGGKPTVEAVNDAGALRIPAFLCGPCFFGEARMLDPQEWNK